MAPETRACADPSSPSTPPDRRCDIYSMGVALYEAVTLAFPYDAADDDAYARAAAGGEAVPLRRRNPAASKEMEAVLRRCLERDPARRYQSAGALAADLRVVATAGAVTAREDKPLDSTGPREH
jgi:eukaryotic-like serine/threonine-protein kinase